MKDEKKLRILMIVTTPFYLEKGSSLRIYSILKNLSSKYFIDLVTYPFGKDIRIKDVFIHRVKSPFNHNLKVSKPSISKVFLDSLILLKCLNLMRSKKYDIIHCEDFEAAAIGRFLAPLSRSKLVYDLHNRINDNLEISFRKNYLKRLILVLEAFIINRMDLMILNWKKYLNDPIFKGKNKFLY